MSNCLIHNVLVCQKVLKSVKTHSDVTHSSNSATLSPDCTIIFAEHIFKILIMKFEPIDCHEMSAGEIVELMIKLNPDLKGPIKRQKVYVGATGNIEERLRRHKVDKPLFYARTASQRTAAKVEEIACSLGFCIGDVTHGGNGTNSHSIYVYAFEID